MLPTPAKAAREDTTMTPVKADPDEIRRALHMLFAPGQVTELRALEVSTRRIPRPHTVSGYFDDVETLANEAAKVSRYAKGVYIVPNVVDPALLVRAANRVRATTDKDPLTADSHILRRQWLLIDADPVRPAGISSTDAEHAAGLARVQDIAAALTAEGWPAGAQADSGNGGHLLYQVDLPNDDASRTLLERVLQALAFRFDDVVTLDQKVFNAGRIWKLYGTAARKGDHTAGAARPSTSSAGLLSIGWKSWARCPGKPGANGRSPSAPGTASTATAVPISWNCAAERLMPAVTIMAAPARTGTRSAISMSPAGVTTPSAGRRHGRPGGRERQTKMAALWISAVPHLRTTGGQQPRRPCATISCPGLTPVMRIYP
jgi:hypothetical protein